MAVDQTIADLKAILAAAEAGPAKDAEIARLQAQMSVLKATTDELAALKAADAVEDAAYEAKIAELTARVAFLTPAPAEPTPPVTTQPPAAGPTLQQKLDAAFGVFAPYNAYGKELPAWEAWIGKKARWMADNGHEGDWNAAPGSDWGGGPEATPPHSGIVWSMQSLAWNIAGSHAKDCNLVIGVPAMPKSYHPGLSTLEAWARGDFDVHHRRMAGMLKPLLDRKDSLGNALRLILRCWEGNGHWMAWYGAASPAMFREGMNRMIQVYKTVDARFAWNICFTLGAQGANSFALIPDVTLLNAIDIDFYDEAWVPAHKTTSAMSAQQIEDIQRKRFAEAVKGGAQGLVKFAEFAAANKLKMSFSEWACRNRPGNEDQTANGGDNPWFIQGAYDHFVDLVSGKYPGTTLEHQCYFERSDVMSSLMRGKSSLDPATGKWVSAPTLFPNAAARYKQLFGPSAG